MEKSKKVIVKLVLRQGDDGHWLHFESTEGKAVINIENNFPRDRRVDNNIRLWAKEQFE